MDFVLILYSFRQIEGYAEVYLEAFVRHGVGYLVAESISGCPSVTDSEVNNMFLGYTDMMWVPYSFSLA